MPLSVSAALAVAITGVWWVAVVVSGVYDVRGGFPDPTWQRTREIAEAYDRWVMTADSVLCPDSIDALKHELGMRRIEPLVDAWGTRFTLRCEDPEAVAVVSAGPDRTFGTPDDISSRDPWRSAR